MQADKDKINRLIKTAKGQLDGILKMIEDDRYCIDISNQLMATEAIIHKANKEVLLAHIKTCVRNVGETKDCEEKIEELIGIINKLAK